MRQEKLADQIAHHPDVRILKIEAVGDFWRGGARPKIRLTGKWLERAGFKPGYHVHVRCACPGVLELRFVDCLFEENEQPYSERSETPF